LPHCNSLIDIDSHQNDQNMYYKVIHKHKESAILLLIMEIECLSKIIEIFL
jgi:hypothetical protein